MSPQNELDKNLTVILTLKDRVSFTYRWMTYANESCFPFKVLIADGGLDKKMSEVLSNRHNYPHLDYEYIRYPYDETYSIYHAKKADVLTRVKTPFAVFTDNDDFLISDGLREAIAFLIANTDYSTCRGETYSFILGPDLNALYGNAIQYLLYKATSLEQETALARISRHFEEYSTTYYDVHRIDDVRECFRTLHDFDIKDVTIAELLTSFMTVASGKVKKIAHPYLLRQYHMDTNCAKEDRLIDRFDRMLSESWSDDFTAFVKTVAAICVARDNIRFESAMTHVKNGYRKFIDPVILSSILKRTVPPPPNASENFSISSITSMLKHLLPLVRRGAKKGSVYDYSNLEQYQEITNIREFLFDGFKTPDFLAKD